MGIDDVTHWPHFGEAAFYVPVMLKTHERGFPRRARVVALGVAGFGSLGKLHFIEREKHVD